MGVRFRIQDDVTGEWTKHDIETYSLSESSIPLAGGDSSGAVGTFDVTTSSLPEMPVALNVGKRIALDDFERGSTLGTIRRVSDNRTSALRFGLTGDNRLGDFNIEVQAEPFSGTLANAFRYYCSLANILDGISVEDGIGTVHVDIPGWKGNLWDHMKMFAQGVNGGCDLLVSRGRVILRPLRKESLTPHRETESSSESDGTKLALKQEVVWHEPKYVERGLIYPPGGWSSDVKVYSVNAGEYSESTLETNSSIFSIEAPTARATVAKGAVGESVYTIVGDDGIVVQPEQWADYGGTLSVDISEDRSSLILKMQGPVGIARSDGKPMQTFRVAMASGTSADNTYSTLRIVGKHISLTEKTLVIPTGVEEWQTAQEFAPTIDNPFLTTLSDAYSAGTRGARRNSGRFNSLSATTTSMRRRSNLPQSGTYRGSQAAYQSSTYGDVLEVAEAAGRTYQQDVAWVTSGLTLPEGSGESSIGDISGGRLWDERTRRWYRVRTATITPGTISLQADEDNLFSDVQSNFSGLTYQQVTNVYGGKNYSKVDGMGIASTAATGMTGGGSTVPGGGGIRA